MISEYISTFETRMRLFSVGGHGTCDKRAYLMNRLYHDLELVFDEVNIPTPIHTRGGWFPHTSIQLPLKRHGPHD